MEAMQEEHQLHDQAAEEAGGPMPIEALQVRVEQRCAQRLVAMSGDACCACCPHADAQLGSNTLLSWLTQHIASYYAACMPERCAHRKEPTTQRSATERPQPGSACTFAPVSGFQAHGIPAADIKKLKEGGIHTIEALAHAPKKELTMIKGISEAKVEKLQKEGG